MIEGSLNVSANKLQFLQDFFNVTDIDSQWLTKIYEKHPQIFPVKKGRFFEPKRFEVNFEANLGPQTNPKSSKKWSRGRHMASFGGPGGH